MSHTRAKSSHYNRRVIRKIARLATRSVRYFETGSGRPLVLLHAFPLNAEQWLPQFARVPPGWRLVAPDYRGFGDDLVGKPAEDMTVADYADDVFELMSHLDIRQATVCGVSMGGYVALAMVRRQSERVSGLVLADTRATADTPEGKAGRDRMLALVDREGAAGVAREMIPKLLGETTRREQPDMMDALTRIIEANGGEGLKAAIYALKNRPDSTDLLPGISCPTLVICGAEDVVTPVADSERLHHGVRGSRLVVLPAAGHLSNLERPFEFSSAVWSL